MRQAKASDMRHKVDVYEQVNVRDPKTLEVKQRWLKVFSLWCREVTVFREQLETLVSGAAMLRDRKEFECRYTRKLNTKHRIKFNGEMYRVSIVGDTEGKSNRIRFLAESLKDGGA